MRRETPEEEDLPVPAERKLLVALLKRAVLDFCGTDTEEAQSAREWFFSEYEEHDWFTFPWVCEQLGLDMTLMIGALRRIDADSSHEEITRFLPRAL